MFAHYYDCTIAGHPVAIHFQGYFRDEVRLRVTVAGTNFTFDVLPGGTIKNVDRLSREIAQLTPLRFSDVAPAVISYFHKCPPRSTNTPPGLIQQPFHFHRNPHRLSVPGIEECHNTGEVVDLIKKLWPDADIYEGGHHVVATVAGKRLEIHETWDPQTCLGSTPPTPAEDPAAGLIERFLVWCCNR